MAKRVRKIRPADQVAAITGLLAGTPESQTAAPDRLRHFTPDEHIAWVEANCYRDTKGVGWQPLQYSGWQKDSIRRLFGVGPDGALRYRTVLPCFPRRCDKTGITARYDLYRAIAYDNQLIVIQGMSEEQGAEAVLSQIADTIEYSPKLRKLREAGDIVVLAGEILFANGSRITVQSAAQREGKGATSGVGLGISVYHNTEGCKANSDALLLEMSASTGDKWCGLTIVDSNMGDADNLVARYVDLAELALLESASAACEGRAIDETIGDPSVGAVYIAFADLDDCLRRGCGVGLPAGEEPIHPWLDAAWIRGQAAKMTGAQFARNHLNKPSGAGTELWSAELIDPLFVRAPHIIERPHDELAALLGGRPDRIAIGVGLDRASAFAKLPDRSVLPVVARCVLPDRAGTTIPVYDQRGEVVAQEVTDGSVYVLLAAWEFMFALRDPIQDKLLQIDRHYGIDGLILEAYQASDLYEWAKAQRFGDRTQALHMTAQAKGQLVVFFHGLVATRRFIAPASYPILRAELTSYREESSTGNVPSYGGPRKTVELDQVNPITGELQPGGRTKTWVKDDYAESLMWACLAARGARPHGRASVIAKPAGL